MKSFRYTGAALAMIAVAALLAGCAEQKTEVRASGEEIDGTTAAVQRRTLPVTVSAVGGVEAEHAVEVVTRMMGWVKTLHVDVGDEVRVGQRLLTIDDGDLRAKRRQVEAGIAEAEAMVANAEKMAARFENLYAEKSVSRAQLDDVLTGLERARAGLARAEAARAEVEVHLGYLDIRSPIDGVVSRRLVDEGDMANPGHPLLFVEKTGRMKIIARLGEKDVDKVRAGDLVDVEVTSLEGARFRVPVDRVLLNANPGSRTYDVEAFVENDGRLRSGMYARMDLDVGSREGVTVPREAIVERGQLRGVFTVDGDGEAHLRWVRLGGPVGDAVEVISGLEGGETVVTSSAKPLSEGDKVVNAR